MERIVWYVFLLILIFLLVQKRNEVGKVINAASAFSIRSIQTLQGQYGHSGRG